jgi:hypothetical protein
MIKRFSWMLAGELSLALLVFGWAAMTNLAADDLVTRDGITYRDYKVLGHDDGYIMILYADGGGKIPLNQLPGEMQKQYGYDPAKAAAFVHATEADWEAAQARVDKAKALAAAAPTPTPAPPAVSPVKALTTATPAPAQVTPPVRSAPAKPAVDTFANEAQIKADQTELENLEVDIRVAERDKARDSYWPYWNAHYDNTGTLHPNTVGVTNGDRLTSYNQRKTELETEIAKLKQEDQAAGAP